MLQIRFKQIAQAANPGSILEDFIRWYSPRDWIESAEVDQFGQKKGSEYILIIFMMLCYFDNYFLRTRLSP